MKIKSFVFNPFMENTYVVYDDSGACVIIDPGCYEPHEKEEIEAFIDAENLKVELLINTHCHIDHVLGNYFIKNKYQVPLLIHEKDLETLKAVPTYAAPYGFAQYQEVLPDQFMKEGETIAFGQSEFKIVFVPGHAPGHVALYNLEQNICIGGDVLFDGSIGRTDLPGGDFDTLINSIQTKMFQWPDAMTVYPGHGGTTTIGKEKLTNPFCKI